MYQGFTILALFLKASWFASAIRHIDQTRPMIVSEREPQPEPHDVVAAVEDAPVAEPPAEVPPSKKNPVPVEAPLVESMAIDGSMPEKSDAPENLDARA